MHSLLIKRFNEDFPEVLGLDEKSEFRCYSGWGLLLYGFFLDATEYCRKHGGTIRIRQIKEKFGRLRIYCAYDGGAEMEAAPEYVPEAFGRLLSFRPYPSNKTLSRIIDFYEMASEHCCEMCGRPGHIDDAVTSKLHWVSTLCFEHANLMIDAEESDEEVDFNAIEERVSKHIESEIMELKKAKQ